MAMAYRKLNERLSQAVGDADPDATFRVIAILRNDSTLDARPGPLGETRTEARQRMIAERMAGAGGRAREIADALGQRGVQAIPAPMTGMVVFTGTAADIEFASQLDGVESLQLDSEIQLVKPVAASGAF